VLSEGKVTMHTIDADLKQNEEDRKYPAQGEDSVIVDVQLTETFLILLDKKGRVTQYIIKDNLQVSQFKPDNPID